VGRQQPVGTAPDQDLTLMSHALELPELVAGDLMRSRDHMRSFRDGMDLTDVMAEFAESRYSRYPWFDRDGEEVLGILHMKDLLVEIARGNPTDDLRPLLRPVMHKFDEAVAMPEEEKEEEAEEDPDAVVKLGEDGQPVGEEEEEAPRERSYRANLALAKEMARDDPRIVANVIKAWVGSE